MISSSSFGAKYKVIQKIGEGSFSEVLKCEDKVTGTLYAAKRLKKTFKSLADVMTCAEIIALHKLSRHPNVLYMIEYFYDPSVGKLTYVFELMDMSMYEYMKAKKRPMTEIRVKNYLYQMLKGLEHLHKNGLFHRDIKPENILVKLPQPNVIGLTYMQTEVVKLADLGSIRGIYSKPPYTEYISTRWYRSPECLLTVGYYGPKMDVWAAGCVFYEMLTLKPLFPGTNEIDQLAKIHAVLGTPSMRMLNKLKKKSHNCQNFPRQLGAGLSPLLGQFSEDCRSVLKLMIQYDPESRINVRRLVDHRYFAPLREQYLYNQFKFTALQKSPAAAEGMVTYAKCTGDHVMGYLSLAETLKQQTKVQGANQAKVYNPPKPKKPVIPISKTSAELNPSKRAFEASNRLYNASKTKKSPMGNSKTSSDLNHIKHGQDKSPRIYGLCKQKKSSPVHNTKTTAHNVLKHRSSPKHHNFAKSKKSPNRKASDLNNKKHRTLSPKHPPKKLSFSLASKTAIDLNVVDNADDPKHWQISPKSVPLQRTFGKASMQGSKTVTELELDAHNKHLIRDAGGPLVSHKQFKEWGVSASILKPKQDPNNLKQHHRRHHHRTHRHHHHHHQDGDGSTDDRFRKTTSNLPQLFKEEMDQEMGSKNNSDYFQSKSFVLPRRVAATFKLPTIKENNWLRNPGDKSSLNV